MDYEDVMETIGEIKGGTAPVGVNPLFGAVGNSRIGATPAEMAGREEQDVGDASCLRPARFLILPGV